MLSEKGTCFFRLFIFQTKRKFENFLLIIKFPVEQQYEFNHQIIGKIIFQSTEADWLQITIILLLDRHKKSFCNLQGSALLQETPGRSRDPEKGPRTRPKYEWVPWFLEIIFLSGLSLLSRYKPIRLTPQPQAKGLGSMVFILLSFDFLRFF